MKHAVPAGLAFVIFLPLLAVLKYNKPTEQFHIKARRVADFQNAMENAIYMDQNRENELGDVINALQTLNVNTILNTTDTGVTTNETCKTCFTLFRSARVAMTQFTRRELKKMSALACSIFAADLVSPDICQGLIDQYLDSVYNIAERVFAAKMSQSDICGLMFGPTCGPVTAKQHTWKVNLPKKLRMGAKTNQTSATMKILHISDIHYDPRYRQGAIAQCDRPLCCRELPEQQNPESNLLPLVISTESSSLSNKNAENQAVRISTEVSMLAGHFGDTRHCDMPLETIESLVNDAVSITDKISHVYLTGDIPPHDVWKSNKTEYWNITRTVYQLLADKLSFDVPVFPAVGNHEAVPPNLFSTETSNKTFRQSLPTVKTLELYESLADIWQAWLADEQLVTVRRGGFYAKTVSPALKVISLNTNMCYYLNLWLLADSRDPAGQLAWLVRELADSEGRGQFVHILGHVPPSSFDCIYTWSEQFLRIVQRFNSTITGQFYGHTHFDQFNMFYSEDRSTPVGVAFIAPSATSYTYVNPAYKLYTYRSEGVLYNSTTRSFDLAMANSKGSINWQAEYDVLGAFGIDDLSPSSMDYLSKKLNNDLESFNAYFRFYHRNSSHSHWANCTETCRSNIVAATATDVHHQGAARFVRQKIDLLDLACRK